NRISAVRSSAAARPQAARPAAPRRDSGLSRDPVARLESLFDAGTLRLLVPADDSGVATGTGNIDGMTAVAFASDPRIQGGAMGSIGCAAIVAAYDHAIEIGVPVIGLWHSGGARLQEGVASLHAVGTVFAAMTRASGKVPQISVVLGAAAGGAAYGPALTDLVILSDRGRIFVTGPDVVRSVTGEDVDSERLGGPAAPRRRPGAPRRPRAAQPPLGRRARGHRDRRRGPGPGARARAAAGPTGTRQRVRPCRARRRPGVTAARIAAPRLRRAPADQRAAGCSRRRAAPALGPQRRHHARPAGRPGRRRDRQ